VKLFKKEEGFTLVELMVVVLIIGILVAIAIPVFNAARARAEERTCHANQRTIEGAVQQYLADDTGNQIADLAGSPANLVPAFLAAEPLCPTEDSTYVILGTGLVDDCPNGLVGDLHGHY